MQSEGIDVLVKGPVNCQLYLENRTYKPKERGAACFKFFMQEQRDVDIQGKNSRHDYR